MINKFGQDIKGYPFDKAQSFASEERRTLNSLFGDTSGIVSGIGDQEGSLTTVGLQTTIGTVTIAAKGSWYRTDTPIKVTLPPSVSGYILARVDLSEENTSTGSASDGSYNYALNQVRFLVTTESPVKENLLLAGNIYDIILAKFTTSTTNAVVTDSREFAGRPLVSSTGMIPIGRVVQGFRREGVNNAAGADAGWNFTQFIDTIGASYIPTRYLKNIYKGLWEGYRTCIFVDNGGINPSTNLGESIYCDINGTGTVTQLTGNGVNVNGYIRSVYYEKLNNGEWRRNSNGSLTENVMYDSQVGNVNGVNNATPNRPSSFFVEPGTAKVLFYSARLSTYPSGTTWKFEQNIDMTCYLAEGAKQSQILTSSGQHGEL